MRKLLIIFFTLFLSFVLVACESTEEAENSNEENNQEETTEEQTEEEEKEKAEENEPIDIKVEVNEEINFDQFDVTVKEVKAYEKDEKILADIKLNWKNNANEYGDQMTFYVATLFDVKQNDESLEEINDAWNPENQRANDVFFPNALGGNTDVNLTYELFDTSPIDIVFTPTTETEGSETITVNFH